MYQLYVNGKDVDSESGNNKVTPDKQMGSLGKIEDARKLFERLFKK